jgi:hypothetical protein
MTQKDIVRLVAASLALLAAGVWLGGLLVLGAIVAPVVFREVPAPSSADAMVIVFTTFDKLAMTCAAVIAVAEVVRFRTDPPKTIARIDVVRLATLAVAGALAVVQGVWLSPAIVSLHRDGAVRGLGPLGERLDRIHAWSETCGKTESVLLIALVVLLTSSAFANRPIFTTSA